MIRPQVTLKLATSLDGRIALASGQSQWISSASARACGRQLRATHDAIAVGIETVLADNPRLTVRQPGSQDPVRVIFDSRLRLPLTSQLVQTASEKAVWVFCLEGIQQTQARALTAQDVRLFIVAGENRVHIQSALEVLHRQNIKRLLLEGGGHLAAAFLKADCIDHIEWFRAPIILGGDGRAAIAPLALDELASAYRFTRINHEVIGEDMHETYQREG